MKQINRLFSISAGVLLVMTLFLNCSEWELPFNPFDDLIAEDVMKISRFDGLVSDLSILQGIAGNIPEEISPLVTVYKWEYKNLYNNEWVIIENIGDDGIINFGPLVAEEYTLRLTIKTGEDEEFTRLNSRSFTRDFIVYQAAFVQNMQVLGIREDQDSGYSNEDCITQTNHDVEIIARVLNDEDLDPEGTLPLGDEVVSRGEGDAEPSDAVYRFVIKEIGTANEFQINQNVDGNPLTVDSTGTVTAVFTGNTGGDSLTIADGVYSIKLVDIADESKASQPLNLVIDNEKPLLSWRSKMEGEADAGEGALSAEVAWSSSLLAYDKISASNDTFITNTRITKHTMPTDHYDAAVLAGSLFDKHLSGDQLIEVTAEDYAGNIGNAISRTLTVSDPILPVITNGNFEACNGTWWDDLQPRLGRNFNLSDGSENFTATEDISSGETRGIVNDWFVKARTSVDSGYIDNANSGVNYTYGSGYNGGAFEAISGNANVVTTVGFMMAGSFRYQKIDGGAVVFTVPGAGTGGANLLGFWGELRSAAKDWDWVNGYAVTPSNFIDNGYALEPKVEYSFSADILTRGGNQGNRLAILSVCEKGSNPDEVHDNTNSLAAVNKLGDSAVDNQWVAVSTVYTSEIKREVFIKLLHFGDDTDRHRSAFDNVKIEQSFDAALVVPVVVSP